VKKKNHHVKGDPPGSPGWIEYKLSRHRVKQYIDKYIRIKPFIMNKIDQFEKDNFRGSFVISIHYRGTEKFEHEMCLIIKL